jgi:methionyl-tRNA synthetase
VGERLERSQFKAGLQEAMRTVAEANKYISDQAPWALKKTDPERMATVLHVALQLVQDANTLLTPYLPESANKVYAMLGGTGTWTGMPRIDAGRDTIGGSEEEVEYPVITGDYADNEARWESRPIAVGTPLGRPEPLFAKLDQSVVDEELARLEGTAE